MGPLPAHHNSDGKGQRASNDERHASDDLSGTFTMLVTCGRCLLFRSVGDHARDVRCGRSDPRRQPALGLPCRLPGDRLLVRPSRPAVQCRLRCAPPDAAAICRGTVAAASSTKCVHHAPLTDGSTDSTDIVAWVSSVCVGSETYPCRNSKPARMRAGRSDGGTSTTPSSRPQRPRSSTYSRTR